MMGRAFFFGLLLVMSTAGCALTAPKPKDQSAPPLEKVFAEPFDHVWKATLLALAKYPMKISDQESGIFETGFIRGESAWVSPNTADTPSGGQRYKISIRIIKGKSSGEPATKLTILKRAEIQRDFFSEFEKMGSDGLEEMAILYRIEREIEVAKLLARVKR